ncbi:MAG TPA: ABC transporter ATP-binding protein [Usitatibacter sp.]|nr:ABC transporter ATP-binding protein [Usitatibacter sp.]
MAEVVIEGLTCRYGSVTAVDDVSLAIADGEFVTLLGPSGCGKSTTLAALAGLDEPHGGRITVGGKVFFDAATGRNVPTEQRNCGLVFQSYALWPHMTVAGNCEFPLKLRKVAAPERRARVAEALKLVEMDPYAERYPHELSGGQQQRVALARTLVYRPTVLLLDEPLSNLDARLRERSRVWLSQVTRQVGLTTVYVTHDQSEALALSDRIAVMNAGKVSQLGTPQQIYDHPSDPFVADFIGSSNFLEGRVQAVPQPGRVMVELPGGQAIAAASGKDFAVGSRVQVALRPERLVLHPGQPAGGGQNVLRGRITGRSYLGARTLYLLDIGGTPLRVESDRAFAGEEAWVEIPESTCVLFPAEGASPP